MGAAEKGVVAAGHPLTAEAGVRVLREGGNAVDAAVGAMLTSFAAEQLLTGLGAGGYMLVAGGGEEPTLLDFFVEAPSRRSSGADEADGDAEDGPSPAELRAVDVSFGDAAQVFHIGPASCGGLRDAGGRLRGDRALGEHTAGRARGARRRCSRATACS